ncbi:MAG: hypothetical protein JO122_00875 [Acetobacteraceae bacterium]|nr:hypothetical protein [Acetobacteraceae bacterium]
MKPEAALFLDEARQQFRRADILLSVRSRPPNRIPAKDLLVLASAEAEKPSPATAGPSVPPLNLPVFRPMKQNASTVIYVTELQLHPA